MPQSIQEKSPARFSIPLDRIASICRDCEQLWSSGSSPDLSECLSKVPQAERATLLRNLLHLDLSRRRAAGEQPSEEEYISRLPQYADVIRGEFQASTLLNAQVSRDTATFKKTARRFDLGHLVRLGEYVLEKELGRGAMGVVFAARHLRHGARVALKTLPIVDGPDLHRFKVEFRSLADLNHRNLVGLHSLQTDAGQWFFTMDLVDGEDFRSYVCPGGKLDVVRLRHAFAQLVIAVHALHARHIVHRDLKPSNVMVTPDGDLRVLDYGLVLDLSLSPTLRDQTEIGGTPVYMAPEQLSVNGTSEASDWYAVGVMLYEALAGQLPFTGSITQVFADKREKDPPPLSAELPDDLTRLCRGLLAREPKQRPSAEQILDAACPNWRDQTGMRSTSGRQVHLVGRENQIEELEQAIRSFETQTGPSAIFISGRSGEGKTMLAEHVLEQFRSDPQTTLLAGRCYDRESVPFKAIDSLIDALCSVLKAMPNAQVKKLLSADAAVLAELFPVLNRVDEIAQLPKAMLENLEVERVRQLAADALREILSGLSRTTRLICFIDDLQWGDAESAELLLGVLQAEDAPKILLLGTFRSDEADTSRFLQTWSASRKELSQFDCRLEPLGIDKCIQLVVDIVGVDNEAVRARARQMTEETGGNPFLLSELASCLDPTGENAQTMQMEEVVERKLKMLPDDARALLDIVSVSGKAIALDEASLTAGHLSVPLSTITRMRTERLLRMVGSDANASIDTYHDRIRETVLRDMNVATRKGLHIRLADQIEATNGPAQEAEGNPRIYDLAYHCFEGGDSRAFGYQMQAGEAATRAFALENALEHFKKAEQVIPETSDGSTRYSLYDKLGDVCGKTQRLPEGLQYYEKARPYSSSPLEKAAVHDGIGEMHHRMGQFDAAVASFDTALASLGYRRPNWLPQVLLEVSWLLTLCQLMWLVRPCRTTERRNYAKLASVIYHRIAELLVAKGDIPRYTDACVRIVYTALRSGDPGQTARSFAKLGFNNAAFSLRLPARWMCARALRFAKRSGDPTINALVEGYYGIVSYHFGNLAEARIRTQNALKVIDRQGESWGRIGYYHNLRHVYSVQGYSDKEVAAGEIETSIGEAASDRETICWGHYGLAFAKARMGNLIESHDHKARCLAAIEGRNSMLSEAVAYSHIGFVYLQSSDYSLAIESLDKSRKIIESGFRYIEYMLRTYPMLIEANLGPQWLTSRNPDSLREASRWSLKSRFFGWRFPTIAPHSLRVRGRLLFAKGRRKQAVGCFQKSIDSARKLGAEFDVARGLLDLAAVTDGGGKQYRDEAVAILRRIKAVIPRAERWQLGEQGDEDCIAPPWTPAHKTCV